MLDRQLRVAAATKSYKSSHGSQVIELMHEGGRERWAPGKAVGRPSLAELADMRKVNNRRVYLYRVSRKSIPTLQRCPRTWRTLSGQAALLCGNEKGLLPYIFTEELYKKKIDHPFFHAAAE